MYSKCAIGTFREHEEAGKLERGSELTTAVRRALPALAAALLLAAGMGAVHADTWVDSDGDGWSDEGEYWGVPGSDPYDPTDTPANPRDTDGDGCSDFDELEFQFCDANPYSNGSGGGGSGGADSDGDGWSDEEEYWGIPGSDPYDPTDTPANPRDTDGDGCSDFDELEFQFCDANPTTGGTNGGGGSGGGSERDNPDVDVNLPACGFGAPLACGLTAAGLGLIRGRKMY